MGIGARAPRVRRLAGRWWETAVVYEVYPRSFADASGDGVGDLAGITARLDHLADLGVDAVWIAPWYPSPLVDGGYDVSDYQDIHPVLGSLEDAETLITAAHERGLRLLADMVVNHTSERHPWFVEALAGGAGSAARARYFFRDGRGPAGDEPPNNWISAFGGSAWSRVREPDGRLGQWYLHTFAPEQPDLDWSDDTVVRGFDDILRFWFDRGVDGLRIDAAPALAKAHGLPDADYGGVLEFRTLDWSGNPHWDVDRVHDVLRRFRTIADEYDQRVLVAEAVVGDQDRLLQYLRSDEMHSAFNFPYLKAPWDAQALRSVIDETLRTFRPAGVAPTWALESHDEVRVVSRYGRSTTSAGHISDGQGEPVDLAVGTARARAAALVMLALPGSAYLYQGEELGLPDVDDLPTPLLQDPIFRRSGGAVRGRDGCRVPLPWSGEEPPFGFAPAGVVTWLPQPADWAALTVERQRADPESMLSLHRTALRLRRELIVDQGFAWVEGVDGLLAFDRGAAFRCVLNLTGETVRLRGTVLVSSAPLAGDLLPHDAAAWLSPET